jgi:Domain of unknown function (DUF4913)
MTADPVVPLARGEEDAPEPVYASVQDWVSEHFLPVYRRPLGGEFRWCAQWWRHAEAIIRLTALWQSWEAMRLQPGTGTANWLRDHLDHQLLVLLGRAGPFAQCSADEHVEPRIAAADPPPPGWWEPEDDDPAATRLLPVFRPGSEPGAYPRDDASGGQP